MSVYTTELWQAMERKAEEEGKASHRDDWHEFVAGVREVCDFGIARAKTIRETFPLYTLHDETHICNVLRLMHELLGNDASKLTRDEAAMLVICACCHDVGMSYADKEKEALLNNKTRINEYLKQHPAEYVRAYAEDPHRPHLDDAMQRSFFRSIHHERVQELLQKFRRANGWPRALAGSVGYDAVIRVCESHGHDVEALRSMKSTRAVDERMCAILLRLADILDFDDSRTPKALYEYCGFETREDAESKVSNEEWQKHRGSWEFTFPPAAERAHAYLLEYYASCDNPQVEQGVRGYLDWVDKELRECRDELGSHTGRWQNLVLPQKIERHIESVGYESGSFRLTLDQNKVIDLLVGNDLYTDQSVFVRELIQNAIDAVRTRQELDKYSPEPRISIHPWTDNEGFSWFIIEDNGVGMTKETILNHLLKVGSSYYESDTFEFEKRRHHASPDYTPISRFGIGILSCFMANDESAQVEISTRHYEEGSSGLRLSINGTSGFYRLCNSNEHFPDPGPMKTVEATDEYGYLYEPGTVVAVRTNLYALGVYGGFKEIVDKYVAFPPVPIHYKGDDGVCDYPTEQQLVAGVCGTGTDGTDPTTSVVDLPIPTTVEERIRRVWPEFRWPKDFKVQLGRLSLGAYAESPHVAGVAVAARAVGDSPTFTHRLGMHEIEMQARVYLDPVTPYAEGDPTISLGIIVRPTGMDGNAVNRVTSKYKKFVYSDDIISQYKQREDFCLAGILDALRNPSALGPSWRTAIRERFKLTDDELNQEVERARRIIGLRTGLEPQEIDLALQLSQEREWHVVVCNLSSLGWFKKWFGDSRERCGHRMLVAHNGIACGSAESLLCDKDNGSRCVAAILLLKDKFRPNLGLARDGIRGYTLETQLVLELMRRRMQADGYYLGEDYPMRPADHPLLAAAAYEDVLAANKALAHDLTLAIDGSAEVRIDELAGARQIYKLAPSSVPILQWDDRSGTLAQRYQRFCLARAQQVCTIRTRFHDAGYFANNHETWLYPKEADDLPQGYRLFPPAFFALPLSSEDTCLTASSARRRHHINATHKLARFLLKNAQALHDRTPGMLMEFIRSLAEDDRDELVSTVKRLIERLHGLPKDPKHPLDVPADLTLEDADLS